MQRVVLEQHQPVVQAGRLPVAFPAGHAGRQVKAARGEEPRARAGQGRMAALEPSPGHRRLLGAAAGPVAHPLDHPGRQARDLAVGAVQVRDQFGEPQVVLGQPGGLRVQRPGQPGQLLIGGQGPVTHQRRGRHDEVDRAEQGAVEVALLGRQRVGRGGGQPDQMHVAQLGDGGPHNIAPQRGEVMALVEHHRSRTATAQRLDALTGARRQQVAQPHAARPGPGDLPLQRRRDASQFPPAAGRRLTGPGPRVTLGVRHRGAGGPGPLRGPAPLRDIAQRHRGILELAQRLVGQAGYRRRRVGGRHARRGAELARGAEPLLLHGGVRRQDERPGAEPADHLHAQQGLSGPGRSHDIGGPAAVAPVVFEGVQDEGLVAAPRVRESEPAHLRCPADRHNSRLVVCRGTGGGLDQPG